MKDLNPEVKSPSHWEVRLQRSGYLELGHKKFLTTEGMGKIIMCEEEDK